MKEAKNYCNATVLALNKLEKMSSLFSYEPWVMTLVLQDSDRLTLLETTFGCSRQNQSIHSPSEGCNRRGMLIAIWSTAQEETACLCSCFFFFLHRDAFWREPRGEGTRRSSSSSYALKCRSAIVLLFCILTCVLRCPGAQVPGYSDLVPFCPP